MHNGLSNLPLFPYLFSLCEPKTSCSFIQSLKKKKKTFGHSIAAHGEEQTLSDISAGRQGGRFFPMGWRLPPYFQNTPLPKNTPSWVSSTKGADPALSVSKCPHPFLFLLHPVAWEWHKSLGNTHHKSVCSPFRPGSGLILISRPSGPSSKPTVIVIVLKPKSDHSIYLRTCHGLLAHSKRSQTPAYAWVCAWLAIKEWPYFKM